MIGLANELGHLLSHYSTRTHPHPSVTPQICSNCAPMSSGCHPIRNGRYLHRMRIPIWMMVHRIIQIVPYEESVGMRPLLTH